MASFKSWKSSSLPPNLLAQLSRPPTILKEIPQEVPKEVTKEVPQEVLSVPAPSLKNVLLPLAETPPETPKKSGVVLNEKQRNFVDFGRGAKQLLMIGSAGVGKSTSLRTLCVELKDIEPLFHGVHKFLPNNALAILIVSFTNPAVENSRRILGEEWSRNIHTIHRALEYSPIYYQELDPDTNDFVNKMRFEPTRNATNPCPEVSLVIIEEAGQCSLQLHDELRAAFPNARFIYLGDIYQLPPLYGSSILGYKLADSVNFASEPWHPNHIPCIELTEVYRQALDSPILARAIEVKNGKCDAFLESNLRKAARHEWISPQGPDGGKLVVHVINEKTDPYGTVPRQKDAREAAIETLNVRFGSTLRATYMAGAFDVNQDVVLIPHRKPHTVGAFQMNRWIADAIREKEGLEIHEVIAGFNKHYFAIGDRVTSGKVRGRIVDIARNKKYFGKTPKLPTKLMNRWGMGLGEYDKGLADLDAEDEAMRLMSPEDIDQMLASTDIKDRTTQASHIVRVRTEDGIVFEFITSAEINGLEFSYALSCHQAQGSEWNRVFIILHSIHAQSYSREWLYTALTRAKKECIIICRAPALQKCVERQKIRGETLLEKAEFFKGKQNEKQKMAEVRARFNTVQFDNDDEDDME